ncbi:hypothetical protein CL617_05535 [archaeon]|nr:hypothetical protein [archaeon]|tara:strand:+ start:9794 stop:10057 length:264 start_codon:yes stop_codon:yes gene_type:complete
MEELKVVFDGKSLENLEEMTERLGATMPGNVVDLAIGYLKSHMDFYEKGRKLLTEDNGKMRYIEPTDDIPEFFWLYLKKHLGKDYDK